MVQKVTQLPLLLGVAVHGQRHPVLQNAHQRIAAKQHEPRLRLGADRVVLGDLPFRDWSRARELVRRFGLRVVATLDVMGTHAVARDRSWTSLDLERAITNVLDTGVEHVAPSHGEIFAGSEHRADDPDDDDDETDDDFLRYVLRASLDEAGILDAGAWPSAGPACPPQPVSPAPEPAERTHTNAEAIPLPS